MRSELDHGVTGVRRQRTCEIGWIATSGQERRRLFDEIAKTPAKVLRMKKLAINRVVDLAGFRNSLLMGAETDALFRNRKRS